VNSIDRSSRPFMPAIFGVVAAIFLQCPAAPVDAEPIEFALVHQDAYSDGPAYDFRMSIFEVRNDQFVDFLNDALDNPDNELGAHMYFNASTHDVHVGTSGGGALMFDLTESSDISFGGGVYVCDPGFENHPVTGVTWFGAVKFCNWLTISTGLSPDERSYTEGDSAAGWHPVTISETDWALRDLDATERQDLASLYTGYRLPMDGGEDAENNYGEWYMAAGWNPTLGNTGQHTAYGFGRDVIDQADANYDGSGDPFEPGTTPVGFFDGTLYNPGGSGEIGDGSEFQTQLDENYHGLFDMSGNVWEWVQDQSPADPEKRRFRGGSWVSSSFMLQLEWAATSSVGQDASDTRGFRVAQCVADGFLVTPSEILISGIWGGPYEELDQAAFTISNVLDVSSSFTITGYDPDPAWLDLVIDPGLTIDGGSIATAEVLINNDCGVDGLSVGANQVTLTFELQPDGPSINRDLVLTVTEPLEISPSGAFESSALFGSTPTPVDMTYTLESASQAEIEWSVVVDPQVDWLDTPVGGVVAPLSDSPVVVAINEAFSVTLAPGLHEAAVTIADDCSGETFERDVLLDIGEPFSVDHADGVVSTGIVGGPFDPDQHIFGLTSLTDVDVDWSLVSDPEVHDWVSLDVPAPPLVPMGNAEVTAEVTAAAGDLEIGSHCLILSATESTTQFAIDRTFTVDVVDYVTPEGEGHFSGPLGGPFEPSELVYTLVNQEPYAEIPIWISQTVYDDGSGDVEWLTVPDGLFLLSEPPDDIDQVTLTLNAEAEALSPGSYWAEVHIERLDCGVASARTIHLTIGAEAFSVELVNVPQEDQQPEGPDYLFRIGKYEITNDEFVRFLNDAYANPANGRGQYMDHDTTPGTVRLTGDSTILFATVEDGDIAFEDGIYSVESGFDSHPVTGVSWYGAVKFCNWLTLIQGMGSEQRVYSEGPTVDLWYAQDTHAGLVANYAGYRLVMDDGVADESAFNEWYKAAAWLPDSETNAAYAFGRDTLVSADANYLSSDDPFETGSSPVGYFNGTNLLADGFGSTNANDNGYHLYDMCGNVAEWVHDIGSIPTERGVRGGHFHSLFTSALLHNNVRDSMPADSTYPYVGFRIAQAYVPVDLTITPDDAGRLDAFVADDIEDTSFEIRINNPTAYTVDTLSIATDVPWLEVLGISPTHVPPHAPEEYLSVSFHITDMASSLSVSPAPPGSHSLIRGWDTAQPGSPLYSLYQPAGPEHDFWIATSEITNAEFVSFLNDTYLLAVDQSEHERAAYMYFHLDTGSVYINDQEYAEFGTDTPPGDTPIHLYDAGTGHLHFDAELGDDGEYFIEQGYDSHPVVGVTWYGAVKYCNWLSLVVGHPTGLRAYLEGPIGSPQGWRPLTANDWANSTFTDAERLDWATSTIGYRLPMDDIWPTASLYNEWYKASSWNYLTAGAALYGFGRDAVGPSDANYRDSGDTEEDDTTPIAFFNGTNTLFDDETLTTDTDNAYGLYDTCGNVAEWTTDFSVGGDPEQTARSIRGGHWSSPVESDDLLSAARVALMPDQANTTTGFRIVRGTGHVATITITDSASDTSYERHVILDLHEPLVVTPQTGLQQEGIYRTTFSELSGDYTITNLSDADMNWELSRNQAWVDLEGPVPEELTGTVSGGGIDNTVLIHASTNQDVDLLGPGEHIAIITFANTTTGESETREVTLSITQPIAVEATHPDPQEFTGYIDGPFTETLPLRSFGLSSLVSFDLDYSVSADAVWLDIESSYPLVGTLPALEDDRTFDITVNDQADLLAVGEYEGTLTFTWVDAANDNMSDQVDLEITLVVVEPIVVNRDPCGDPCDESWPAQPGESQGYRITNNHVSDAITVQISADVDWIDIDDEAPTVLPGGLHETITASINENADLLEPGIYNATLTFHDLLTNQEHTRDVVLTAGSAGTLAVAPFEGFDVAGRIGGPFRPSVIMYRLTNIEGGTSLSWSIGTESADPPDTSWVLINGDLITEASGDLESGEEALIAVSVNADALGVGLYTVDLRFNDGSGDGPVRNMTLSVVDPLFDVDEQPVSANIDEPSGPVHSYMMATCHTSNAEFVVFLNDAIANPGNERGQYIFVDTTTGDVYVNDQQQGESGEDPGLRNTRMFSPTAAGQIEYSTGTNTYEVVITPVDYSDHPVTGVTWYGAVKYCNWLTIDQGMISAARCYAEDTDASLTGWRPVTITQQNWEARDLDDGERLGLISTHPGYRLPMDEGYDNVDVGSDMADDYNEWYKAAAWNDGQGTHTVFGFGRDTISGADGNYIDSGDPFDNGTTPGGYYDGSDHEGAFATTGNDNTFNVFDMSGNAYQWIQGRFNTNSSSIDFRTMRGGSFNKAGDGFQSCEVIQRTFAPPSLVNNQIGFRVVRVPSYPSGDADLDGDVDSMDHLYFLNCLYGPDGEVSTECRVFDFDYDLDVDLMDFTEFARLVAEE